MRLEKVYFPCGFGFPDSSYEIWSPAEKQQEWRLSPLLLNSVQKLDILIHVERRKNPVIVYLNGKFLEKDQAVISVDDRAFLFADGVYEVIRSYGGRLFKLDEHLKRLERSLREIRIEFNDVGSLGDVARKLVSENRLTDGDALVYLEITRGTAPRIHTFPRPKPTPNVYLGVMKYQAKNDQFENGLSVILVPDIRWARCDIKSVGLLPNVLMAQRALDEGADDAVFVRDGIAIEGTSSNFFGVFDSIVTTHAKTNFALPGITRDLVLELCNKNGVRYQERPILESEVLRADELFLTSTALEVTPIVKVNGSVIGNGKPGPVTRRIQKAFRDLLSAD